MLPKPAQCWLFFCCSTLGFFFQVSPSRFLSLSFCRPLGIHAKTFDRFHILVTLRKINLRTQMAQILHIRNIRFVIDYTRILGKMKIQKLDNLSLLRLEESYILGGIFFLGSLGSIALFRNDSQIIFSIPLFMDLFVVLVWITFQTENFLHRKILLLQYSLFFIFLSL